MKKSELVTLVAEKTGFSKKDTEKTIDTVFTAIADIMAAGDKLQISGFGTFETKERAARTGHNPRTGEEINIAAATMPVFKPGKVLKDKVEYDNQNYKRQKLCDDRAVIRQSRHFIQCHNHGYTSLCNVL